MSFDFLPMNEQDYHDLLHERFGFDDSPREHYLADCSECPYCGSIEYDLHDHLDGGCQHQPDETGWTRYGREVLNKFTETLPDTDFPARSYRPRVRDEVPF